MFAAALVLLPFTVLLVAARFRFPGEAGTYAAAGILTGPGLVALGIVSLGLAGIGWRRLPPGEARARGARVLGFFTGLFAFIWGWLAPSGYGRADFLGIAILLVVLLGFFAEDLRRHRSLGLGRAHFLAAMRWLAPGTALALIVLYWRRVPTSPDDSTPVAVALVTYPVYALAQILVFQVFLVRNLRRMGTSPTGMVATTALLFALVHWPNPFLMGACLLGMAGWTWVYLRRPNAYAVALSMGLVAAALAQWAPQDLTHHMRVGPNHVVTRARHAQEDRHARRVDRYADDAYFAAAGGTLDGWISSLYRDLLRREPTPAERRNWVRTLEREYRAYVVRQFHNGEEYRARHPHVPLQELQVIDLLRRDFHPGSPGYEHLDELASEASFRATGGAFHPWLRSVYQTLLDRTPTSGELHAWPAVPKLEQRRHVVEEFLVLRRYRGLPDPDA